MTLTYVPIGQVKRDVSELINRVAYGNERVVLTSRGKPKAAIVSMADLARLQALGQDGADRWTTFFMASDTLSERIRVRRSGELIDVAGLISADNAEQEARDDRYFGA